MRKHKKVKQVTALLLALVMVLAMLPVSATEQMYEHAPTSATPDNLAFVNGTADSVTLSWDATGADSYVVYRWQTTLTTLPVTATATGTTHTSTGLTNAEYFFAVVSVTAGNESDYFSDFIKVRQVDGVFEHTNRSGESNISQVANQTTWDEPSGAASFGVVGGSLTPTSVTLMWNPPASNRPVGYNVHLQATMGNWLWNTPWVGFAFDNGTAAGAQGQRFFADGLTPNSYYFGFVQSANFGRLFTNSGANNNFANMRFITPPDISDLTIPDTAQTSTAYSATLTTSGNITTLTTPVGLRWSIADGELPPGLALVGNTISGTPFLSGTYDFTLRADNSGNLTFGQTGGHSDVSLTIVVTGDDILTRDIEIESIRGGITGGVFAVNNNFDVAHNFINPTAASLFPNAIQVAATGLNLTYTWYKNDTGIVGDNSVQVAQGDGAAFATFALPHDLPLGEWHFYAVVSNDLSDIDPTLTPNSQTSDLFMVNSRQGYVWFRLVANNQGTGGGNGAWQQNFPTGVQNPPVPDPWGARLAPGLSPVFNFGNLTGPTTNTFMARNQGTENATSGTLWGRPNNVSWMRTNYRSNECNLINTRLTSAGANDWGFVIPTNLADGTHYFYHVGTYFGYHADGTANTAVSIRGVSPVFVVNVGPGQDLITLANTNMPAAVAEDATLEVNGSRTDGGTITYQWYFDDFSNSTVDLATSLQRLNTGRIIAGATSNTLVLDQALFTSLGLTQDGDYWFYAVASGDGGAWDRVSTASRLDWELVHVETAVLATLTVSPGTLTPYFSPATTGYAVNVASDVASITIDATGAAGVTVGGDIGVQQLNFGANTFAITAELGAAVTTYTITVTRAPILYRLFAPQGAVQMVTIDVDGTDVDDAFLIHQEILPATWGWVQGPLRFIPPNTTSHSDADYLDYLYRVTFDIYVPAQVSGMDHPVNPPHLRFDHRVLPVSQMQGGGMILTPEEYWIVPAVFNGPLSGGTLLNGAHPPVTNTGFWYRGDMEANNGILKDTTQVMVNGIAYIRFQHELLVSELVSPQKDEFHFTVSFGNLLVNSPVFISGLTAHFGTEIVGTPDEPIVFPSRFYMDGETDGPSINDFQLMFDNGAPQTNHRGVWGGHQSRLTVTEDGTFATYIFRRYEDPRPANNSQIDGQASRGRVALLFQPAGETEWHMLYEWADSSGCPIIVSDDLGNVYIMSYLTRTENAPGTLRPWVAKYSAGSWNGTGLDTPIQHFTYQAMGTHAANTYVSANFAPDGRIVMVTSANIWETVVDMDGYMEIVVFCTIEHTFEAARLWTGLRYAYVYINFDDDGNIELVGNRNGHYRRAGHQPPAGGGDTWVFCGLGYWRISRDFFSTVQNNYPPTPVSGSPIVGQPNHPANVQFVYVLDHISIVSADPALHPNHQRPWFSILNAGDVFWDDNGNIHIIYNRRDVVTNHVGQMWHTLLRRNEDGSRTQVFNQMIWTPSASGHSVIVMKDSAGAYYILATQYGNNTQRHQAMLYRATGFADTGWTWTREGTFSLPVALQNNGFSQAYIAGIAGHGDVIHIMYPVRNALVAPGSNADQWAYFWLELTPDSVIPVLPEFSWNIFNNGPGGTQYPRANPGLAANGTIRMWAQLDGANTPVYLDAADTIVAVDQNGHCAMQFVRVNRMWVAGQGWADYFNMVDVNKNGDWQYINLYITVYGQTVHVLLANALFEIVPAEPKIVSVTPNPATVEQGGVVEILVTTQGMPDGAWVDLNVWRAGLSIVGGPRFYIVNNQATITVAASDNAPLGRDGFAVTARTTGDWGSVVIIDSYAFVIEIM